MLHSRIKQIEEKVRNKQKRNKQINRKESKKRISEKQRKKRKENKEINRRQKKVTNRRGTKNTTYTIQKHLAVKYALKKKLSLNCNNIKMYEYKM